MSCRNIHRASSRKDKGPGTRPRSYGYLFNYTGRVKGFGVERLVGSAAVRNDKQEQATAKAMRGFFAALRMTDKDKKQIPPLRYGMTNKNWQRQKRNAGILRCAQNDRQGQEADSSAALRNDKQEQATAKAMVAYGYSLAGL